MEEGGGRGQVKLHFRGSNPQREYEVPATTTARKIKAMIQRETHLLSGIPLEYPLRYQVLTLQLPSGEEIEIHKDNRTLEHYGLDWSTPSRAVWVKYGRPIAVMITFPEKNSEAFLVKCWPPHSETVGDFKERIYEELSKTNTVVSDEEEFVLKHFRDNSTLWIEDYRDSDLFVPTLLPKLQYLDNTSYIVSLLFRPKRRNLDGV